MTKTEIYQAVIDAMQPAEELGGPEGEEYVNLMQGIADECTGRIAAFRAGQTADLT